MTTPTTTDKPMDTAKLTAQAVELRKGMAAAIDKTDDVSLGKLGRELAAINKQITEAEDVGQVDARNDYMGLMHDALSKLEIKGLTLTVKFDATNDTLAVVYTPTDATIGNVKGIVAGIDRPSSATKWHYYTDDQGQPQFEFPSGRTRSPSANGTRTEGWTKDGQSIALGDAFEAVATPAEKTEYATKEGGSAQHAFKSKIVKAAGYSKS